MTKKNKSEDIYFYRPDVPFMDTSKKFEITTEDGKLRVKNKNVNCLFSHLTPKRFDTLYNQFNQRLNLDFEPLIIEDKVYAFTTDEAEKLFETIVTSWIYFYTINTMKVEVKRADFTHPYMVDYVLGIMDKKYKADTKESLVLGAKILRQNLEDYIQTVKARRMYYDR